MRNPSFIVPYAIASVLWLITYVAVALVAVIAVRPRRELAGWLMLGAAGMWFAGLLAGQLGPQILLSGVLAQPYAWLLGWFHLAIGVWGAVAWGLFLYGLVDLCHAAPLRERGTPAVAPQKMPAP